MSEDTERPSKIIDVQDYYEQPPNDRTVGLTLFAFGSDGARIPASISVQVSTSHTDQKFRLSAEEAEKLIHGLVDALAFIDDHAAVTA